MASRIASLAVSVTARTAKFDKAMASTAKKVKIFSASVAGAALASFTAAGVVAAANIQRAAAAIDAQAKLGRSIGATAEEMGTYQLAAGRAGTSTESFVKAARKLTELRFMALERGSGAAQELFEKLGITAKELKNLGTSGELLREVGARLGSLTDTSLRTALASQLLGSRQIELINAFTGGGKAMREAAEDAKRFGLVVDEVRAGQIESLNDKITELGTRTQGFWTQLTAALAPGLALMAQFAENVADLAIAKFGSIEEAAKAVAISIARTFESIGSLLDTALIDLQKLGEFLNSPVNFLGRGAATDIDRAFGTDFKKNFAPEPSETFTFERLARAMREAIEQQPTSSGESKPELDVLRDINRGIQNLNPGLG